MTDCTHTVGSDDVGNGDPLLLTARERDAPLAHDSSVTIRETADVFMDMAEAVVA